MRQSKAKYIYYVCKASRKWHTSKSQPPFTCWLRCVKFRFQNTVCWGSPPSARNVYRSTRAVWSGDPLWPTRPPEPLHHWKKGTGSKRKRINPCLSLPWQRHRCRREGPDVFWIQDPPFPKKVTGGCPCCLATGQYRQLPKFLESKQVDGSRAWDPRSNRIKALRVRMRQLISPLIVISTWMGRSQHMTSLVKVVDELHEDNSSWHLSGSIVENGVDIPLIIAHQWDVKSTGCWRILRHQQQCQKQGA